MTEEQGAIWLTKIFHDDDGHASCLVCPRHAEIRLADMAYDPLVEGPWEVDEVTLLNRHGHWDVAACEDCEREE